jgi:YgiT-type zinc finger domain-containing protein
MEQDKPEQTPPLESCPECQVGTLRPGAVPYYAILEGTVVTVPNFPAWVCDVCRHCEYDEDALEDLRAVLGPSADLPTIPYHRRRVPADNPPPWAATGTRRGSK